MKYYIGDIEDKIGEYEFSTTIRFKTDRDPEEYLDSIAKTWYSTEYTEEEEGYYSHSGDTISSAGTWQELDEGVYNQLTLIVQVVES